MATTRRKNQGYVSARYEVPDVPDYVVAELRYDSGLVISPTRGVAAPSAEVEAPAQSLNDLLAGFDVERVVPHFPVAPKVLATRAQPVSLAKASVSADFAQGGFLQIVPKHAKDAKALAARLKMPEVSRALARLLLAAAERDRSPLVDPSEEMAA